MTDQTQTVSTPTLSADSAADPTADPAAPKGATASASPLDVLDQILSEAQSKSAKELESKEIQEEKATQERLAQQRIADQIKLQQQQAELANVKYSPQYQAAASQKTDAEKEREAKAQEMAGMEITQLGHLDN